MSFSGKFPALLATARVANLPSVVVNVWCGMALALVLGDAGGLVWADFGRLALAGCFLYLAGTFANDWMDRDWDAEHRPERALPTGIFPPRVYLILAIQCAVLGLALAAVVSLPCLAVAGGIVLLVVCYTLLHKRTPWAVLPMGLCRAALPVMGAFGVAGAAVALVPALALLCYIAGLSLAARAESSGGLSPGSRHLSRFLHVVPVLLALGVFRHDPRVWLGIGPYALWLLMCGRLRSGGAKRLVSLLLAGIPLVDGMLLVPLGLAHSDSLFGIVCLALPPLAVLAALALQRVAPAT